MSTARRASQANTPGGLVISRSLGESFSVGDTWHITVSKVTAQEVTLAVTHGERTWTVALQAGDRLDFHNARPYSLSQPSNHPKALPGLGANRFRLQATRITSNDARLAIHAPRSLAIRRSEHDANGGGVAQ